MLLCWWSDCVFQSSVCYVKAALPRVLDLLSVHFRYSRGSESAQSVRSLQNLIHNIYSQRCVPPLNEELEVCMRVSHCAKVCIPLGQMYVSQILIKTLNACNQKLHLWNAHWELHIRYNLLIWWMGSTEIMATVIYFFFLIYINM